LGQVLARKQELVQVQELVLAREQVLVHRRHQNAGEKSLSLMLEPLHHHCQRIQNCRLPMDPKILCLTIQMQVGLESIQTRSLTNPKSLANPEQEGC
jgi:hypothetical protein